MELAGHTYRRLAEEIGEVLQAAAETAEKMQEEARAEAARIRGEAEAELRVAYAEGRRILDEARMEADMLRAEAEWQSQEVLAQARRQSAERTAGANTRLADIEQAESRVLDRLAGVGQLLADTLATLREGRRESPIALPDVEVPDIPAHAADDNAEADGPTAKIFFVEFPPPVPPAPLPEPAVARTEPDTDIDLSENPGASLFDSDRERSEWAPPPEMPTWWTRNGVQS